jgi:hypothetical protein
MLRHLGAALVAFGWSLRYQSVFGIKIKECSRYWFKAVNLALCYQGFASDRKMSSCVGAGKAAFFCCAYDVITDWRDFDPFLFSRFESLTKQSLTTDAAGLAIQLYRQEKSGILEDDGLSRGTIALEFVTKIMGSESFIRREIDFNNFGIVMQIVDDVFDVEEDQREQKTNSLFCEKRNEYLKMLIEFPVDQIRGILPHGIVLWRVVGAAQKKAKQIALFPECSLGFKPFVNINCSPNHNITQKNRDKILSHVRKKPEMINDYAPKNTPKQTGSNGVFDKIMLR